jgi:hypothetical protein
MDLGEINLLLCWVEVVELGKVSTIDVDLESEDDEYRRDGGYPTERFEAKL